MEQAVVTGPEWQKTFKTSKNQFPESYMVTRAELLHTPSPLIPLIPCHSMPTVCLASIRSQTRVHTSAVMPLDPRALRGLATQSKLAQCACAPLLCSVPSL